MEKVLIDEELKDLIPGFIENRQEDISLLYKYIENKDFHTIKILGHSMKGFGAGYGFQKISDIGAVIEWAAINQDSPTIEKQIQSMKDYLDNIEIVYIKE